MRYRLPDWARPGSDETLALLLTATLCASGPAALLGTELPRPSFLPLPAPAILGVAVVIVVSLGHPGVGTSLARIAGSGVLFAAAGAGMALLMAWRADAWFAPEPLYEATALMLGTHLAGLAAIRLAPRLPPRIHRHRASSPDLGASAARLARALIRAADGWLALFWGLVALGQLHASAIILLLALGSVLATLPLRLLVGTVGQGASSAQSPHKHRQEAHSRAASI